MARKRIGRRTSGKPARKSAAKARPSARKQAARRAAGTRSKRASKARAKARPSPAKRRAPAKAKPVRRTKPQRRAAKPAPKPKIAATVKAAQPEPSAAAAQRQRHAPSLDRSRRQLREVDDNVPTPPSSLDLDRTPSAARSGRQVVLVARSQHNETSPELTGGDVDASWEDAYAVGDEAPGGDNPTPDQDRVDDIGRALGVEYQDNEELKASEKISKRDKHRWELDPASAEDYQDRDRTDD
jgi:hypothetical protein